MADPALPRYPVYILSKNRYHYKRALTARALAHDGVPFILAVESTEVDHYRELARQIGVDPACVHDVGFHDLGEGCASVRNWITDHARDNGHARQWQLDDNNRGFYRIIRGDRIYVRAGVALRVCEDFTDRYENIALSGPNYDMFGVSNNTPFRVNCHVYSCTLVNSAIDCRWRGPLNEDTDMCLQVLARGWCTVQVVAYNVKKIATGVGKSPKRPVLGGMSDLYEGDGRLKMARSLEQRWPGIVAVKRRFGRPQHVINWKKFRTPLKLRDDIDFAALPPVDEYGMTLETLSEPRSEKLRRLRDEYSEK